MNSPHPSPHWQPLPHPHPHPHPPTPSPPFSEENPFGEYLPGRRLERQEWSQTEAGGQD